MTSLAPKTTLSILSMIAISIIASTTRAEYVKVLKTSAMTDGISLVLEQLPVPAAGRNTVQVEICEDLPQNVQSGILAIAIDAKRAGTMLKTVIRSFDRPGPYKCVSALIEE